MLTLLGRKSFTERLFDEDLFLLIPIKRADGEQFFKCTIGGLGTIEDRAYDFG